MTQPLPTEAEIAVLDALVSEGVDLFARSPQGSGTVTVRLRYIDPKRHCLVIDSPAHAIRAEELPVGAPVLFEVLYGEWRVTFTSGHAEPIVHDGGPAFRVGFPARIAVNRRCLQPRASVPQDDRLKLVAYAGAAAIFEGLITDVNRGGIGVQIDFGGD